MLTPNCTHMLHSAPIDTPVLDVLVDVLGEGFAVDFGLETALLVLQSGKARVDVFGH